MTNIKSDPFQGRTVRILHRVTLHDTSSDGLMVADRERPQQGAFEERFVPPVDYEAFHQALADAHAAQTMPTLMATIESPKAA